jgi:hypothetical protein
MVTAFLTSAYGIAPKGAQTPGDGQALLPDLSPCQALNRIARLTFQDRSTKGKVLCKASVSLYRKGLLYIYCWLQELLMKMYLEKAS